LNVQPIERHRQAGAALLIALLTVALASILAISLVERAQRDLARTEALVAAERSWQLAGGMEGLARDWIRQSREAGLAGERLDGQWSTPFPVPGGLVVGRLFDLDGRFNLNALAHRDPARAASAARQLAELLRLLDVDAALAPGIVGLVGRDGGRPPLRLAHVSELNRLQRFTPSARARLLPYLSVLPDPDARLNLNRATPEVLAASIDGLSLEAARAILSRAPFAELEEALGQPEFELVDGAELPLRLSVDSHWFLAQARVRLDATTRDYFRLINASGGGHDFRYLSQGIP